MPISRARAAARATALAAIVALAGCEEGLIAGPGAPASIAVAGGAVIVAGPPGYCVDRRLSRSASGEAFVALGSCAALSTGGTAPEAPPAVLTATVSAGPAAAELAPAELERFLRSPQGRAALSRSGTAESVEILATRREAGAIYLHIRNTGAAEADAATDNAYWRGVFVAGGHLVTATVMAFADQPLSRDAGFRRLEAFVARTRAATVAAAPSGAAPS